MDHVGFQSYRAKFTSAMRKVLAEQQTNPVLSEAGFPAYTDSNKLANFLFWQRIWKTVVFLDAVGPYSASLDFGCGSGVMLPLLSNCSDRVVGLDINTRPFEEVSQQFFFRDRIEVYQPDKRGLDSFAEDTFDAIVALDVLEHVEDIEELFAQFSRIGKKGAVVVVSGPTENIFYRMGRRVAGKEYTGDYHKRNIYDIRRVMGKFMRTTTLATLYYPFPLFKIYVGLL